MVVLVAADELADAQALLDADRHAVDPGLRPTPVVRSPLSTVALWAAALVARGFAELTRFAAAHSARPETMAGLSGLGDLILTSSGPQSRNFAFGFALGAGQATPDKLAEGAFTAAVLVEMARAKGVDMPVSAAVDAVLQGRLSIDAAIEALMARPQKAEG